MVDRFLQWRLPENFSPDAGISFKKTFNENSQFGPMEHKPIGTNLFDAIQATAMVQHMLEGMPDAVRGDDDKCGLCGRAARCEACAEINEVGSRLEVSEKQIQSSDTPMQERAQRKFYNACLILMNLDMDELVGAGVIEPGNLDRGGSSWERFSRDPLTFIAKIGDGQRSALWRLIESRQPNHAKED
ncbi:MULTISPECIES: hypothetical protein [unclassified Mesorhizobium]|nr:MULTISPECIES: hypothetical protein [unclassified Mesorhizobium]